MTDNSLLIDGLKNLKLDKDEYISLLEKLIGESRHLQNNPRQGLVPKEELAVNHVMNVLESHSVDHGGPLIIQKLIYKEGRPNLKITYPATTDNASSDTAAATGCIGFIGSHLDVVPANPETWERDPFVLSIEGDDGNKLYGRGTTDCLGHIAMLTLLLKSLAMSRAKLKHTIVALFIAGEEGGESGVGIDMVVKNGHIDELKATEGSICYWIDSADSQPCCGTAGALEWHLKATGKLFHSGLPHHGINSIELISEALKEIQDRFYKDFPPHPLEAKYGFSAPSTLKPTQIECSKGSLNQICPWTTVSGDIRVTPFYDIIDVMNTVNSYVDELNRNLSSIATRGPVSKFILMKDDKPDEEEQRGKLEITWAETDADKCRHMEGVACNLNGLGLSAISEATNDVKGCCKPYSITGSLPLVRDMQNSGFDIQITGYGLSKTYHADNEYALLSDMMDAYQILLRIVSIIEKKKES